MNVALECRGSGEVVELPVGDWRSRATEDEVEVLARVRPAVIDIGCGPGRVAHELSARGLPALGIDASPAAVRHARHVGASAIERSVFDTLPAEGRWGTAILFDGNIGIGGDPVVLLRRVVEVIAPDGLVLVELGAPGTATGSLEVRLRVQGQPPGPWFCWARVAADSMEPLARRAGLDLVDVESKGDRHFAWLHPLMRSNDVETACGGTVGDPVATENLRLPPSAGPTGPVRVGER
jgi:SAM-dependent methyltransferase